MTSFLALRASVCVSVVSNPPVMCYGYRSLIERSTSRPSSTLLTSAVGRSVVEWLPDRIGRLTLIIFSHLSGPNFALGASYDSIQRSQAVAWCVVRFSSRET